jgi:hypothetical protein
VAPPDVYVIVKKLVGLRAVLPAESGVSAMETWVCEGAEEAKDAVMVPVPSMVAVVEADDWPAKVIEPVEALQPVKA